MSERLRLEVVTPERRVVQADADEIRLPGDLGQLGVLPGHTPLLTSLGTGPVSYRDGARVTQIAVQGGFAEVLPDGVTVLAGLAETPDEIDLEAARETADEAEAALKSASAAELDAITGRLRWAATRIEVASG